MFEILTKDLPDKADAVLAESFKNLKYGKVNIRKFTDHLRVKQGRTMICIPGGNSRELIQFMDRIVLMQN